MQDAKIESLAHTLKMTGLCSSVNDALRMASTIIGTEQKVSSGFNKYNDEPVKKKMTYQEEIDDLIKKTSPEYKHYHIPVKGYKRDNVPEREVFYELEQPGTGQKLLVKTEVKEELKAEEPKPRKLEVFTDAFEVSQKPLSEMMTIVDHGDVCTNEVTITSMPEEPEIEKMDDFIVPEEKLPESKEPESAPTLSLKEEKAEEKKEELFKEIKEDKTKPHEIKNPIQAVDLMSYFKV